MRVALVLLDGALDSAISLTRDVLAAANTALVAAGKRPRFEVALVAPRARIRTALGATVRADLRFGSADANVVIAPGWSGIDSADIVARLLARDGRAATALLRDAYDAGALVCAGCSGTFLVAEAGLLRRKSATTAWFHAAAFRARYPDVDLRSELTLIREGRVWTAAAALSIVDLALGIVERFAGPSVASLCVQYLAILEHPTHVLPMLSAHLANTSPEVIRAEMWVRAHVREPFSVTDMARATGTSARTLARRVAHATGGSPLRFVRRIRADEARHLLESTALAVDEVARRVGYRDASTLRRLMRQELGTGPRELRRATRPALADAPAGLPPPAPTLPTKRR